MKNKTVKALALAMAVATVTMMGSASIYASDDTAEAATEETADTEEDADDDQAAADEVTTLSDTSDDTAEETADTEEDADAADTAEASDDDQKAADEVAALIDKIYVQERNDTTDEDCKKHWLKAKKQVLNISVQIQAMHPRMIRVIRMKLVRMSFSL